MNLATDAVGDAARASDIEIAIYIRCPWRNHLRNRVAGPLVWK